MLLLASPLLGASPPPAPAATPGITVSLPLPRHSCTEISQGAHLAPSTTVTADVLGQLFASALRLNGAVGHNRVTFGDMLQSFADVLGCFMPGQHP